MQAARWTLLDRLPPEQVLSHDLLEGSLARCATVSDIRLVEDAPVHADVAASRLHRWTRGDWQLLPFLLGHPPLSIARINRWKMIDNLRRSLVAPMSLALVLLALATGAVGVGGVLVVVAAAGCAGPVLGALAGLAPTRDDIALRRFFTLGLRDLARAGAQGLWTLAQLLQLSLLYADAIARACWRQAVSRRHLLEWTPAAAAQAFASTSLNTLLLQHARVPVAAVLLAVLLALADAAGHAVAWHWAAPLLLLWSGSAVLTWWVSQPPAVPRVDRLDASQHEALHAIARDTWRYFERYVDPARQVDDGHHHLPPDNVQFAPHTIVAHRTSPTNIGMYLLAAASAHALGFIGTVELARRLQATLSTLERLPRHRGHFFNWYDTRTLDVLPPAYVSSVDSGNCSAHMIAVAQACRQIAGDGASSHAARHRALQAAVQRVRLLRPVVKATPTLRHLAALLDALDDADDSDFEGDADAEGSNAVAAATEPDRAARGAVAQARGTAGRLERRPWNRDTARALRPALDGARVELEQLRAGSTAGGLHGGLERLDDVVTSAGALVDDLTSDLRSTCKTLRRIGERLRALALEADFRPLYDPGRRLLHIGWRVESDQLDPGHYDLLASESRLTSLLAVAKGDVPVGHWGALGRPFFAHGDEIGLKSWSGSMFEYLMPSLVLDEPAGSVLHQMIHSAVAEQRRDAETSRDRPWGPTPWGQSESAIASQDHTFAYQYGPQGVARLAWRRTPVDEHVIAPYASLMATMVAPRAALRNLEALDDLGARRGLGYVEAVDFTPSRQVGGSRFVVVQTTMAHHQAMALVALTNVLAEGAPRRWMCADPLMRAVEVLLHERAPREVGVLREPPRVAPQRQGRPLRLLLDTHPLDEALPPTQLLTNGRHSVWLRDHGAGVATWEGIHLGRWRDDALRDACGSFLYVERSPGTPLASLSARPAADPAARYAARMLADRVVLQARWPELETEACTWVSPEDDCELRQLTLTNHGSTPLTLTLHLASEVTLSPPLDDAAHPAFANLFVQAAWDEGDAALYLRRRPRLHGEAPMLAAHFVATHDGAVPIHVVPCVDRARWLGRLGSAARPRGPRGAVPLGPPAAEAMPDPQPLPGLGLDTGLDPVAVLSVSLTLPPGLPVKLAFGCAASRDLDTLSALVDKYRQESHVERASDLSHTMTAIRVRELGFDAASWAALLRLNTLLIGLERRDVAMPLPDGARPRCDRRLLWRFGLSGDRPVVMVTIRAVEGLALVQALKRAARWWTMAGLAVDFVVCNAEPDSYLSPVHEQLIALRDRLQAQLDGAWPAARRSQMHVLRERELDADVRFTLQPAGARAPPGRQSHARRACRAPARRASALAHACSWQRCGPRGARARGAAAGHAARPGRCPHGRQLLTGG